MTSERRLEGLCEDLNAALGVILRWIKQMEEVNLVATVQRIDVGVKRLNGAVADHDEKLRQQEITNATTAMLLKAVQDEQKRITERVEKLTEQIVWGVRLVIGAVIAQVLVQIFVK